MAMELSEWDMYRPQRSWGKVMFLHVSVILFTGGSAPLHAWVHPPLEQTPSGTRQHPPHPHPQRSACGEIWATSGRYASYWNAILFKNDITTRQNEWPLVGYLLDMNELHTYDTSMYAWIGPGIIIEWDISKVISLLARVHPRQTGTDVDILDYTWHCTQYIIKFGPA